MPFLKKKALLDDWGQANMRPHPLYFADRFDGWAAVKVLIVLDIWLIL